MKHPFPAESEQPNYTLVSSVTRTAHQKKNDTRRNLGGVSGQGTKISLRHATVSTKRQVRLRECLKGQLIQTQTKAFWPPIHDTFCRTNLTAKYYIFHTHTYVCLSQAARRLFASLVNAHDADAQRKATARHNLWPDAS